VCAANGECFEVCNPDDFNTNTTCVRILRLANLLVHDTRVSLLLPHNQNATVEEKTQTISGGAVAGAVVGGLAGAGGAAALGALTAAGAFALARHWNRTPAPLTGGTGFTDNQAESVFDSPLHQGATNVGANPLWAESP
jgi:hypothetical protein